MEEYIYHTAKNGKEENEEDPGHLIGRFFLLVQNVNTNHDTEDSEYIVNIAKGPFCPGYEKKDKNQLKKN